MPHSISIVVPVYRSGPGLAALHARVAAAASALTDRWELILVDDGSGDGTFEHVLRLHREDPRVKAIRFARNMGQHHATLCGIARATGDVVVTLDDDLQNPPEAMGDFIARLDEGYDMVIGRIASGGKRHSPWRNLASGLVQRFAARALGKPRGLSLSSYRAMSRRAAASIAAYGGVQTYLPALILGSIPHERIANVDVAHHARTEGGSTYSLRKLARLASFLLINHSLAPLRFMSAVGFVASVASLGFAAFVAVDVLVHGSAVKGWASLAVLVTLVGGLVMLSIGIVGEYIGRILVEGSGARQFPVFESHE